jgi:hypothetical protein
MAAGQSDYEDELGNFNEIEPAKNPPESWQKKRLNFDKKKLSQSGACFESEVQWRQE